MFKYQESLLFSNMNTVFDVKTRQNMYLIALVGMTIIAFTLSATTAASWPGPTNIHTGYSGYSTVGTYGGATGYYGAPTLARMPQPTHPTFTRYQSRPSGYGLVQQGPAYNPRAAVYEDPRFAGHRAAYSTGHHYSALTQQPRIAPHYRVPSQERYVPARNYMPHTTQRLPTLNQRYNTYYGTWSAYP